MKELNVQTTEHGQHVTTAAIADYDRIFLQVNGCGRYVVELSVDGTVWSPFVRLTSDRSGSQATIFEVVPGTYYRVASISGRIERVLSLESGISSGGGGGSVPSVPDENYDFGDAQVTNAVLVDLGNASVVQAEVVDFGNANY